MTINLNIKLTAGKRTPLQVDVQRTSVNEKVLTFKNGQTMTESEIASTIKKQLEYYLGRIQNI
ncbi:MAG: hypothetical protein ABIF22_01865 [bacterium]